MASKIPGSASRLIGLLRNFPDRPPLAFAFAYGSQVFKQSLSKPTIANAGTRLQPESEKGLPEYTTISSRERRDMVDLVFAVDDAVEWHRANMELNRHHYSGLISKFGPRAVAKLQRDYAAKVYYNTLVRVPDLEGDQLIKYGVIEKRHLIDDLLDWNSLYIAGRLQKPVKILFLRKESAFSAIPSDQTLPTKRHSILGRSRHPGDEELGISVNPSIRQAMRVNHESALHTALLMLPETFSEEQLFTTIANLSYMGDFRMIFGEDKEKVKKIVIPQIDAFKELYNPYLLEEDALKNLISYNPHSGTYQQDVHPRSLFYHLQLLPKTVQQKLYVSWNTKNRPLDLDDVLRQMSRNPFDYQQHLQRAITSIVWGSSWSQSLKGIFTAGVFKSTIYSFAKLSKMYQSIRFGVHRWKEIKERDMRGERPTKHR